MQVVEFGDALGQLLVWSMVIAGVVIVVAQKTSVKEKAAMVLIAVFVLMVVKVSVDHKNGGGNVNQQYSTSGR